MSLSADRSSIIRLQKEVSELQRKQAAEMKKVAVATKNMNSALASAAKASPSASRMYANNADRESRNAQSARDSAAKLSAEIARKSTELSRVQERVTKAEIKEQRDRAAADAKRRKEDDASRQQLARANIELSKDIEELRGQLTAAIEAQAESTTPFVVENAEGRDTPYDFFISHAWKDKEDFVDNLVSCSKSAGLDVWYDNTAMAWGDSIRQKIDDGLRRSYFGVVVLSPNFFDRPWTQYELDGIVQRDLTGSGRLLPIWHRLTQDDVLKQAPSLAGRLALPTSTYSTEQIVDELIKMRDRFKLAAK